MTALEDGETVALTGECRFPIGRCPVVVSPDGNKVVYERQVPHSEDGVTYSQLFMFRFA